MKVIINTILASLLLILIGCANNSEQSNFNQYPQTDQEKVRATLDLNKGRIYNRYLKETNNDRTQQGLVSFKFSINEEGKAYNVRIVDSPFTKSNIDNGLITEIKKFFFKGLSEPQNEVKWIVELRHT